jgi:lipopolysaccharide exporter
LIYSPLNSFGKYEDNLTSRAAKSSFWIFTSRLLQRILGIFRLIILARLLSPSDFGLMGIALLMLSILDSFFQVSFQTWLIQKSGDIKSYLDIVWTASIIRGFILSLILFFLAPFAANFFGAPESESIIQIIGIYVLFQGFINIGIVYFQKDLQFERLFVYEFGSTLIEFIATVGFAIVLRDVWALVLGLLVGGAARLILSFMVHPFRPKIKYDYQKITEVLIYGKWMLGSNIALFLVTQGDSVFIGRYFGVTALGFYQTASTISNTPATEIGQTISQVTLPVYSKLKHDFLSLHNAYFKVLKINAFLSFFLTTLIISLAPEFTMIFLGDKWMPMVPIMQVLVLAGLARSISSCSNQLFYAIGRPEIGARWQFFRLLALIMLMYALSQKLGLIGVSIAVFLSILLTNIGFAINITRIIGVKGEELGRSLIPPMAISIVVIVIVNSLKNIFGMSFIDFIVLAAIESLLYLIIFYLIDILFNYGIIQIIKENIKALQLGKI